MYIYELMHLILDIYRVRILGIDNLRSISADYDVVYVAVGMFHGGEELCNTLTTNEVNAGIYPRWNQWLVFDTSVRNLPKVRTTEIHKK